MPATRAYLCRDCNSIGNCATECPACGSKTLRKATSKDEWNLSDLPENWTVEDIEARAPQHIKDIQQLHRLLLYMPEHTDGYVPEFFLNLNYDERMAAKQRLQTLVEKGRLNSFTLKTEAPGRADFLDTLIGTLEKGK
jgi:DNA-directed RNA polymerase subunit RPC12/RpoP